LGAWGKRRAGVNIYTLSWMRVTYISFTLVKQFVSYIIWHAMFVGSVQNKVHSVSCMVQFIAC